MSVLGVFSASITARVRIGITEPVVRGTPVTSSMTATTPNSKSKMKRPAELEREHAELSWWLIERKVAYYMPESVHESRRADYTTPDDIYDQREQRYLDLCVELGFPNTIAHKDYGSQRVEGPGMFEVDDSRPCVQLVLSKLGSLKEAAPPKPKRVRLEEDNDAVLNERKRPRVRGVQTDQGGRQDAVGIFRRKAG